MGDPRRARAICSSSRRISPRSSAESRVSASNSRVVTPLREALKRPTLVGQEVTEKDLAEREITVMGDKALPYDVLKKVMRTCTDADYGKISLAVLQKDKPVPPGTVGSS